MAIVVETKDCSAVSDAELSDMADLCAELGAGQDMGLLSKQCGDWVLITQARDEAGVLHGFAFCTLERIGGTPCVLLGLGAFRRGPGAEEVLQAVSGDQLRRAVLAFPDEDVLVGAQLVHPGGLAVFQGLHDVVPMPGKRVTGEERAWVRRLGKRFGAEGRVDDRAFVVKGTGDPPVVLDYQGPDPAGTDPATAALFEALDQTRRDSLIAFGWAMAEDLATRA